MSIYHDQIEAIRPCSQPPPPRPPAPAWAGEHLVVEPVRSVEPWAEPWTLAAQICAPWHHPALGAACEQCEGTSGLVADGEGRFGACIGCRPARQLVRHALAARLPSKFNPVPPATDWRRPGFEQRVARAAEGVIWTGMNQLGKSHAAACACWQALLAGRRPLWLPWNRLLKALRPGGGLELADVPWVSADFVVIDDIGASSATDWTRSAAFDLLDELMPSARLVVTTNLEPEALAEWVGPRAWSRLARRGVIETFE